MKFALFLVAMLMAVVAVFAYRPPVNMPRPGTPGFPTFPGHGPFNPRPHTNPWGKPSWPRFRREAESMQAEEDEPLYVQTLAESVDG